MVRATVVAFALWVCACAPVVLFELPPEAFGPVADGGFVPFDASDAGVIAWRGAIEAYQFESVSPAHVRARFETVTPSCFESADAGCLVRTCRGDAGAGVGLSAGRVQVRWTDGFAVLLHVPPGEYQLPTDRTVRVLGAPGELLEVRADGASVPGFVAAMPVPFRTGVAFEPAQPLGAPFTIRWDAGVEFTFVQLSSAEVSARCVFAGSLGLGAVPFEVTSAFRSGEQVTAWAGSVAFADRLVGGAELRASAAQVSLEQTYVAP